ncbi:methylglyoxal synthase [Haloarcula sp. S1CR25-12]|uniref:Methylglyoxal synthase n=1 Tax=Haloarcula saliterrae TaxID=2950534 RepID=A0ABU2FH16_9EURY|nr:methylglyoxal synthase [Haloarcula sp. S1CR25-12]MDS0261564.1 methylglyoxal synthase [Haloarcula sp. S1CR25-12]
MTRVALIAHDDKKSTMIDLVQEYEAVLSSFDLVATGTTGQRIMAEADLDVERKESGPVGGDTQIGAEVVEGRLDGIVFLQDPMTAQPHEPDIGALMRICNVHDVPLATCRSAGEYVVRGLARDEETRRQSA